MRCRSAPAKGSPRRSRSAVTTSSASPGGRSRAGSRSWSGRRASTSPSSPCTGAAARTAASRGRSSCSASLHRLERARLGAGDGQAQGEGALFRLHNVPTPPYYVVGRDALASEDSEALIAELHGSFGFPVIVKPRGEGSSVGLTKAHDLAELARRGIRLALRARRARAGGAVREGDRGARGGAGRPRARGHRGGAEERSVRLRLEVHRGRDRVHLPAAARGDAGARCPEPGGARGAGARVHRRVPGGPARDRGGERVRPRGEHLARDDGDVAPAEDRARRPE